MARRSARALVAIETRGMTTRDVLTDAAVRNAMIVHAAFGGSTNLCCTCRRSRTRPDCRRPTVDDWSEVNREMPRLVDALPNGPQNVPTVQVFLAGGVPEVMLHLRRAGLLDTSVVTVTGATLDAHARLVGAIRTAGVAARVLQERDGIDPDEVIMPPDVARQRGMTSTVMFPERQSRARRLGDQEHRDRPSVVGADGVYRKTGPARVFRTEKSAVKAIKDGKDTGRATCVVLICRGPMGSGMEEIYEITSALRVSGFRQARRRDYRRALQRRLDRRMHRPRHPRGAGGRPDRQGARRRHDRDYD